MQEVYFIAKSEISKEILSSVMLLKNISVNVLIYGKKGVGKKTLAKVICSNDFYKFRDIQEALKNANFDPQSQIIVVENIENLANFEKLTKWSTANSVRVVATFEGDKVPSYMEDFFPICIYLPPLEERKEDIKPLIDKFSKEASLVLGQTSKKPEKIILNLSQNAISLRKSVYFSHLFETIGEGEIMMLLEKFMYEKMANDDKQNENFYRDFSYLFEAPLLRASQKIHKSQLQMAKFLGLNRITLRKKIEQYKELI